MSIFLKLTGKVLCAAADVATGMHDANAIEQLDIFMQI